MGAVLPCCFVFTKLSTQTFGNGRYRIFDHLGKGTFGRILACKAKGSDKERAAKVLDVLHVPLPDILQEARILQKMNHPNVIKCHEVIYEATSAYIVMDRLEISLCQSIVGHIKSEGKIPLSASRSLIYQMASSIHYLHKCNVVHRDVKSDNFLCECKDVTTFHNRIVLTDFGDAIEVPLPSMRLHEPCGTKRYWAPEFYELDYHMKVDIWALGVIIYNLLTGRFPFRNQMQVNTKVLSFAADVPELMQDLTLACLERSEEKRTSAEDLLKCRGLKSAKPFIY